MLDRLQPLALLAVLVPFLALFFFLVPFLFLSLDLAHALAPILASTQIRYPSSSPQTLTPPPSHDKTLGCARGRERGYDSKGVVVQEKGKLTVSSTTA